MSESDPAQRTLGTVWQHLASEDTVYGLARLLDSRGATIPAYGRSQIAAFLSTAEQTRSGIHATALQQARCLASPLIQRSLAATSFDLGRFRDGAGMTIYLVLPPTRLASHAPVLRLWLAVLLGIVAERKCRPKLDTLFLVDELAQIGAIPIIQQAVTLLRGYGLKTTLFLQSVSQLRELWPVGYKTILDNCANLLTFGQSSMAGARDISEHLGDISPETLFGLRANELAIRRSRKGTVIARKVDYLADPTFRGMADPNPRYP